MCVICAGKLLERSQKIAYNLHKVGSKGDGAMKPGDRVSDVDWFTVNTLVIVSNSRSSDDLKSYLDGS